MRGGAPADLMMLLVPSTCIASFDGGTTRVTPRGSMRAARPETALISTTASCSPALLMLVELGVAAPSSLVMAQSGKVGAVREALPRITRPSESTSRVIASAVSHVPLAASTLPHSVRLRVRSLDSQASELSARSPTEYGLLRRSGKWI